MSSQLGIFTPVPQDQAQYLGQSRYSIKVGIDGLLFRYAYCIQFQKVMKLYTVLHILVKHKNKGGNQGKKCEGKEVRTLRVKVMVKNP